MDLKEMSSNNDIENPVSNGVKNTALMAPITLPTHPASGSAGTISSVRSSHLDLTGRDGVFRYFPWWCFQKTFIHEDVEKLYQEYYYKQKQHDTVWLFVAAAIFTNYSLCLHWAGVPDTWTVMRIVLIVFCVVNALAVLIFHFLELEIPETIWTCVPFVGWILFYIEMFFVDLVLEENRMPIYWTDTLGWTLILVYVIYVLLPARLLSCVLLSCVSSITHIVIIAVTLPSESSVFMQVMANLFLLVSANLLGTMSHVFTDKKHRKSYLETRTAMRVKLELEERTREQERLLLSVLPEHVAQQIRKDIGEVADGQFKKIYMSRHENVSILFADIVGFTAISSTYSAVELVKILNELFARFDKLAEKFHQLRIKILGDCYYCISGAPQERSDHAVLCVHMGLSMVNAINYVREKTKSSVDMRVGIHTGAVLAGILGQRQWQFDVYSKDVELANKMESSGKPGRVHISEKTYAYLNGEFETERGDGSSRDEIIKLAGIKTYFIVKILKPYPNGTLDKDTGNILENVLEEPAADTDESVAKEDTKMLDGDAKHSEENYRKRLFQEQVNRGKKRHLYKTCNMITLSFNNKQMEDEYNGQMADAVGEATLSAPIVALLGSLAQLFVLPGTVVSYLVIFFQNLGVIALSLVSISPTFSKRIPGSITHLGRSINENFIRRHLWIFAIIGLLVLINFTNMLICDMESGDYSFPSEQNENTTTVFIRGSCVNPQYFTGYSVLVLLTITVLLHVSYPMKFCLISAVTALQAYMNIVFLSVPFSMISSYTISRKYSVSALLGSIALALVVINRHMEATTRLLFKWKKEVEEQKVQVDEVMHKTVTLVYNILPQHVANVFLKANMRHDELYSQSYTEVGVLFASMPNFSDFYSEESVNNQGLECLRFLNEVISDFDALLEESRFFDIIKIKTTGATYMAASGLNDTQEFQADSSILERWAHLDRLTQFALALKESLNVINNQSFNNFILRMGINHGPIIAGVIGARKPHYDMWGNTVNVASRMESTGKAGCIQVVEETANILREFGYEFEQRGMVQVKGKGTLMTYYLKGHNTRPS